MEMGHRLRNLLHRVSPPPESSSGELSAFVVESMTDGRIICICVSRNSYIGYLTGGGGGGDAVATDMLASGLSPFSSTELMWPVSCHPPPFPNCWSTYDLRRVRYQLTPAGPERRRAPTSRVVRACCLSCQ